MVSEKLLFAFGYKITATTSNVFRWCLQTVRTPLLKAGCRRERPRHWVWARPLPPQPPERLLKAIMESWGAGHTSHLNDRQMTFTAVHFHFPRHRFRGELFVISCQDNGMSLCRQILISFPSYQSLRTYPLPERNPPKATKTMTPNAGWISISAITGRGF